MDKSLNTLHFNKESYLSNKKIDKSLNTLHFNIEAFLNNPKN